MKAKDINRHSPEGRLLVLAVSTLQQYGPKETNGKEADEVLDLLDQAATKLENFKM